MSGTAVTLAFHEGSGVGLGHRRRVEVVAAELRARGITCSLVPCDDANVIDAPVAVVDSYRVRADDPARVRAGFVVAIDDLDRDLAVDVVVDPAPGADGSGHRRAARVCAGAAFALVGAPAGDAVAAHAPVGRVLVTTGAGDADGVGACMASGIADAMPGADVRLVVGPWGAAHVPHGVEAVRTTAGLAAELAAAPLVVTAGGVTMLEACRAGRATVAVVLADNQRAAVDGLLYAGAVVEATPNSAPAVVARLAADPTTRATLAATAASVIDGKGPARVADVIEEALR